MTGFSERIVWSSDLATGCREVDEQHRQLLDMLNALAKARSAGTDAQNIRQILYELKSYATYHFRLEEDLMEAWPVNPRNRAIHLRAHEGFVEYLGKVESLLDDAMDDAVDHLLAFLLKWLVHHITGMDVRLVRELVELGMPDAEPAPAPTAEETRSVHDALINTVSELYDSISRRTLELLDVNRRLLEQMRAKELAEKALEVSEARYRALADNGRSLIFMTDRDGAAIYFNQPWLIFSGQTLSEAGGEGWLTKIHPDDRFALGAMLRGERVQREKFSILFRMKQCSGAYRWIACEGSPRVGDSDAFAGFVGHCLDISAHRELQQRERLAAQVFETMGEAVMVVDPTLRIERVNAAFTQITGYAEAEILGGSPGKLNSIRHDEAFVAAIWSAVRAQGEWVGEVWLRARDGDIRPTWQRIAPLRDDTGAVSHYVVVFSDLSEVRHAQSLARQLSSHDPLTGLHNRSHFLDRLAESLGGAANGQLSGGVLLINIDQFKLLNEARGFAAGDVVLLTIASRLRDIVDADCIVARIDADEFGVIFAVTDQNPSVGETGVLREAMLVADRVQGMMRDGISVEGSLISLGCSMGLVLYPASGAVTADELFRQAELALQQSKREGRGRACLFESHMSELVRERYELEQELRRAIDAGELRLYLQTQVGPDKQPVGAEALVRWEHPQRGLIPPASFVPIAEASDLIVMLDRWVLGEACRLLASLDVHGRTLRISVNVSPRHFQRDDFTAHVAEVLQRSGADGQHLILEVTEGLVIGDLDDAVKRMHELKKLGIRFSLDDFGTGYSSLSYLKQLPIDELKIDRSFVRDVTVDPDDAALVDTILAVARHMGVQVVAEGVETREQADFLDQRYRVIHQGFFYARPIELNAWVVSLGS